jgi:maltose alpha-D-glucosyltransferase/alpha-amylase
MTAMDQRSLYQSMRTLTRRTLAVLRRRMRDLPDEVAGDAQELVDAESAILARCQPLIDERIPAARTRVHGDYHLGQVLFTGRDFAIIDFEGEPLRPIGERRLKRTPLKDVAGMLRSFDYAAHSAVWRGIERGDLPAPGEDGYEALTAWAAFWSRWVSAAFLRTYLETAQDAPFLPREGHHLRALLDASVLEKAIYEVAYELANRPGWVGIPISGIRALLAAPA